MSFRPGARGGKSAAPRGYVAGLGRGAAGFTTRSDLGPAAAPGAPGGDDGGGTGGSRAAEARAAKIRAQQQQQQASAGAVNSVGAGAGGAFGQAPKGYVAGAGRGAGSMGGDTGGDSGPTGYDSFGGYTNEKLFEETPYDEDDEEADQIYAAIDERMSGRRKRKNTDNDKDSAGHENDTRKRIGKDFRELKAKLKDVSEEEWSNIPDVGDYSLKYKQKRREDVFTPLTDSLLESRTMANTDATAGNAAIGATTTAGGANSGFKSVVTNMSGLAEARGTVLGMSLDKMSDSVSGQSVIDPKGYLTSLSNTQISTNAEVGDINKARLLLKSVRDTNPHHGPGWIAAARVEEAAGKTLQARKIIQEGCEICPDNEDVWLEAARLHPVEVGKSILATAARKNPKSVKIFLRAADLEPNDTAKKAVLRKALEANPTSVTLWKAAIELEDADDARILLSVAVENVPQSVEMWLALARLETYENARKVLNEARKQLPGERSIWIAAAKLEESQNHDDVVDKIIKSALKSLAKHDAVVTREQWLQEAEASEQSNAPMTAAAIARHTIGLGVDPEDRQRTWADDARGALSRSAPATARAIIGTALVSYPHKRSLWLQAVDLERKHGTATSLDEVLAAASERLPRAEVFWLLRAKEQWLAGDIDKAREILTEAFATNPESEEVWLAAAKLEWETGEIERARVLLKRARERAPTDRVYMKSALLERECNDFTEALALIEEGIKKYPNFAKLYMMGGQICSENLPKTESSLVRARKFYNKGVKQCPNSVVLWTLASRLEERSLTFMKNGNAEGSSRSTKARSLLELARLANKNNPELWLESIRLERRAGNDKLATALMARALQECPSSGLLLAENITTAPKVEQKSKSSDAIKRCPEDPYVIGAVATLFATDRKNEKARKWFERAIVLNPDLGDSWAKYYAFELEQTAGNGNSKKETLDKIKERCVAADPKHGEVWCSIVKDIAIRRKSIGEHLELVANEIIKRKNLDGKNQLN